MRPSTAVAALLGAALALLPASLAARRAPEAPELRFEALPELHGVAARLARVDLQPLAEFAQQLGLGEAAQAPVRIVLAARGSALDRTTPPWIAGFADSASSTVVVFPARSPSYPYDSLEAVLRHEIAHVLIARAGAQGAVPRWLHEGLAMLAERPGGLADRAYLALASVSGEISISALDYEFGAGERRAARAYAIANALVRDLIARHGSDFPRRLLQRLAAGDSIDAAFAATAGVPLAAVERAFWRERWWYELVPFVTSSLMIWVGIVVLAWSARRRRAAQRAERRRRWEAEEASPHTPASMADAGVSPPAVRSSADDAAESPQ